MNIRRYLFLALIVGAMFALTACVKPGPSGQPRGDQGQATDAAENAKAAAALAKGLYERGSGLKSFAAQGRINYYRGKQRHFFRFEFVSQKPGSMLLTAFDPAGRPAFKMLIYQNELTGVLYQSGEYVKGPATAENLALFIPVALDPEDLLRLMTGSQVEAASAEGREKTVSGQVVSELAVSPVQGDGGVEHIWRLKVQGPLGQDPLMAKVSSAAYGPIMKPAMSVNYEQIKEAQREDQNGRTEPFPYKIMARWQTGSGEETMELSYDEVRLGADIPKTLFSVPRPAEFKLIQLTPHGTAM